MLNNFFVIEILEDWRHDKMSHTKLTNASFQVLELRLPNDEETAAFRRRPETADGATASQFRHVADVRPIAHRGKTDFEQNYEGMERGCLESGNTNGESITVPLTSRMTGLESAV